MLNNYSPESFLDHLSTSPPDVLYHYMGQTGLLGIVTSGELWATKVQYMDDATEFSLALSMARDLLDEHARKSSEMSRKTAAATLKRSLDGVEDINVFAVCFCENSD